MTDNATQSWRVIHGRGARATLGLLALGFRLRSPVRSVNRMSPRVV
jgi:hypothetical protein